MTEPVTTWQINWIWMPERCLERDPPKTAPDGWSISMWMCAYESKLAPYREPTHLAVSVCVFPTNVILQRPATVSKLNKNIFTLQGSLMLCFALLLSKARPFILSSLPISPSLRCIHANQGSRLTASCHPGYNCVQDQKCFQGQEGLLYVPYQCFLWDFLQQQGQAVRGGWLVGLSVK